jgi:hypothetical protein
MPASSGVVAAARYRARVATAQAEGPPQHVGSQRRSLAQYRWTQRTRDSEASALHCAGRKRKWDLGDDEEQEQEQEQGEAHDGVVACTLGARPRDRAWHDELQVQKQRMPVGSPEYLLHKWIEAPWPQNDLDSFRWVFSLDQDQIVCVVKLDGDPISDLCTWGKTCYEGVFSEGWKDGRVWPTTEELEAWPLPIRVACKNGGKGQLGYLLRH